MLYWHLVCRKTINKNPTLYSSQIDVNSIPSLAKRLKSNLPTNLCSSNEQVLEQMGETEFEVKSPLSGW